MPLSEYPFVPYAFDGWDNYDGHSSGYLPIFILIVNIWLFYSRSQRTPHAKINRQKHEFPLSFTENAHIDFDQVVPCGATNCLDKGSWYPFDNILEMIFLATAPIQRVPTWNCVA